MAVVMLQEANTNGGSFQLEMGLIIMRFLFSRILSSFLFFVISLTFFCNAFALTPYKRIVFFGDSLSDNGNLYQFFSHIIPKSPPYYKGQFSNGVVWTELVANHYRQTRGIESDNYAVGGEVISLHGSGFLPWSFYESVDNYFLHSYSKDHANTLYMIWLGANDYLDGAPYVDSYTDRAIANLKYSIERLIAHGGKNFIIFNLPDLSKTPYSKMNGNQENIAKLTVMHNMKLEAMITQLQEAYKDIHVLSFHINEVFDEFSSHASIGGANSKYGTHIKDIDNYCWKGGYSLKRELADKAENDANISLATVTPKGMNPALAEAALVAQKSASGMKPCADPDSYLFWDKVHPTSVMHMIISRRVIEFVDENFA